MIHDGVNEGGHVRSRLVGLFSICSIKAAYNVRIGWMTSRI